MFRLLYCTFPHPSWLCSQRTFPGKSGSKPHTRNARPAGAQQQQRPPPPGPSPALHTARAEWVQRRALFDP